MMWKTYRIPQNCARNSKFSRVFKLGLFLQTLHNFISCYKNFPFISSLWGAMQNLQRSDAQLSANITHKIKEKKKMLQNAEIVPPIFFFKPPKPIQKIEMMPHGIFWWYHQWNAPKDMTVHLLEHCLY